MQLMDQRDAMSETAAVEYRLQFEAGSILGVVRGDPALGLAAGVRVFPRQRVSLRYEVMRLFTPLSRTTRFGHEFDIDFRVWPRRNGPRAFFATLGLLDNRTVGWDAPTVAAGLPGLFVLYDAQSATAGVFAGSFLIPLEPLSHYHPLGIAVPSSWRFRTEGALVLPFEAGEPWVLTVSGTIVLGLFPRDRHDLP